MSLLTYISLSYNIFLRSRATKLRINIIFPQKRKMENFLEVLEIIYRVAAKYYRLADKHR